MEIIKTFNYRKPKASETRNNSLNDNNNDVAFVGDQGNFVDDQVDGKVDDKVDDKDTNGDAIVEEVDYGYGYTHGEVTRVVKLNGL